MHLNSFLCGVSKGAPPKRITRGGACERHTPPGQERKGRREDSTFSPSQGSLPALMVLSKSGLWKSQKKNSQFLPIRNSQTWQMKRVRCYPHLHATIGSDGPASLGCLVEISWLCEERVYLGFHLNEKQGWLLWNAPLDPPTFPVWQLAPSPHLCGSCLITEPPKCMLPMAFQFLGPHSWCLFSGPMVLALCVASQRGIWMLHRYQLHGKSYIPSQPPSWTPKLSCPYMFL